MSVATDAQDAAYAAFSDAEVFAAGTLSHVTKGTYSASSGGSTDTTATASVQVYLDASSTASLGFKFGADLVRSGDFLATIPAKGLAFTPAEGDGLTMAAGAFRVISVAPTYLADTAIVYELLVRR